MQLLTVVYIIAMCSVLPLFMQSGYYKLGEAKALCYLLMSLCFFVPFIPLLIKEYKERDLTAKKELSLTYLFFYGTVISSLLSFVFSVDKKTALFGFEGWRNGLLTYLAMLFFCFICTKLRTIPQWGVVAVFIIPAIEFLLGIMDRIGVYLLPIQGRNSGYLATIGNINWYAGFLAIFVPVGIGFMYSKKAFSREFFIWGVYVVLGEMALFLQGSDGAVLIVVASFIMLLLFAVSDRQNMKAFLIQLFVLGLSVTAVGMLTTCFPNSYNYEDNLLLRICQANIGLIMMAAAFFVYRVVRLFEEISVDYK